MQKTHTKKSRAAGSQKVSPELKIYGRHASEAIWHHRPEAIIRVYLLEHLLKDYGDLLKWCASNRKAYHLVSKEDLVKITDSVHHEGICLLVKQAPPLDDRDFRQWLRQAPPTSNLLFLDGTANPHNLGAVMRSAAHFGVHALLFPQSDGPLFNSSMIRIARGGLEHVKLFQLKDAEQALRECQSHQFKVFATSSHFSKSIYDVPLPARSLFVFGNESAGVRQKITDLADEKVLIPGTGLVESLNISVAGAILMGEFFRQHHKSSHSASSNKV